MPISQDDFRTALSRFASGVTVVTTKDKDGRLFGLTVSAFCSVSLDPPLVLICIEKATGSYHAFLESKDFVVNILSVDQAEISERFASQIPDKFAATEFTFNIDGIPVLSGCLANLECRVKQTVDGGDHSIFIAEVDQAAIFDGDPLLYFRSDYQKIGDRDRP
ncbi:MAG TPA: flavin reductase family protein [Pyrinomonadaceae bacterium]|jgi:flavin reductase (DIM6/NTAB) family NADH-FMN oxidoreductase RutF|nr:flavin reductase family protein [Pyrinomonadaceae bacterium]